MTEELIRFDEPIVRGACRYTASVIGGYREDDKLWEARIHFESPDGSSSMETRVETEQHDRDDVLYWAGGLSRVYLEGALDRALDEHHKQRLEQTWSAALGKSGVTPKEQKSL